MNEENKNISAEENEAETPSDQPDQSDNGADQSGSEAGKTFTQADVDRIVKERLKRFKAKANEEQSADYAQRVTDLDKRESDLKTRETQFMCKEYIFNQGYPSDLMEVLDTTDFETFKKKADKVVQLSAKMKPKVAPLASESITSQSASGDGFRKENAKHKPKPFF